AVRGTWRAASAGRPPLCKRDQPLLIGTEQGIQARMKLLDLDLGSTLPVLHGVFETLANDLMLHVEILCHGLPPMPSMVLLLLLRLRLSLPRLIRQALRLLGCLPLECPGLGIVRGGRTHIAIRVSGAPRHAVSDLAFCGLNLLPALGTAHALGVPSTAQQFLTDQAFPHLHLLPALGTETRLTLVRHNQPGQQVLGPRPEGTEHLKTSEPVHRLPPGPERHRPG